VEIPSGSHNVEKVLEAIENFFTTCLLSWIEVLIVMESLGASIYAINDVYQWYISVSSEWFVHKGLVCKWADGQHFILEHFDIIQNSPSQVYHYALPFSPSSSWLCESYSSELLQEVRVVKGLQAQWGACSRTVSLSGTPQTIACWNNLIAVSLDSYDIIILDAITGVRMSVLSKHTGLVISLAFSSDGIFLVSGGNDGSVNLWDIQTGGVVNTFSGHTSYIFSVSVSPDCTMIASGSWDGTIQLWSTQTGVSLCYQM